MSWKLALIDDGMAAARSLVRKGRTTEALAQATRLLNRPDLPVVVAADAHRVIAELLIDAERYAKARKHLRAALALEPEHARTQYLLGLAFECDPLGDDRHAARRFHKASKLVPASALYRAAFGRAAVRSDHRKRGVRELLACTEPATKDTTVLQVVVTGLLEAGKIAMARRIITKARFSCPGNREVSRLWEQVRFEAARVGQTRGRSTQDAGPARDGGVQLLPFLRVVHSSTGRKTRLANMRQDAFSLPRSHVSRLRASD
jgi:tetratricopeptide (TPR) repeat protein